MSLVDGIHLSLSDPSGYSYHRWRLFLANVFVPEVFYEIGANDPFSVEGQQKVLKPLMPDTQFFLFEALDKHRQSLELSKEQFAIAVLGEKDGDEVEFYESSEYPKGTGDSCYRERTRFYSDAVIIKSTHKIRTLDSLVKERGWPLPDFIKLDTQGSEINILKGAGNCLAAAKGIQVECNIRRYNHNAPLFVDVLSFLQSNGFRLYDIIQFHYNSLQGLMQVDLIFIRNELFGLDD
jgi:FkbM family methyltransferase